MTTDAVGGVWTYSIELARAFGQRGMEVGLAVLGPRPSDEQLKSAEALPNCTVWCGGGALEWMDEPWSDVDVAGAWLMNLARDFEPEFVHLNDYSHAILPWPCPFVVVAHSCVCTWWRSVKGEAAPAHYAEYRRRVSAALEAAPAVIAPTTAFRKQLAREYGVAFRGETIPNARSMSLFSPGEKQLRVISAGRLWDEAKNLRLLDRIGAEVDVEIAVAGDDNFPGAAQFRGSQLRQLGKLDPAELAEELSRSAIYAAPALYEPFGLAILEAALSGCALILSDLPPLRENWEGCARFVAPDDDRGWIRAVNELAANHRERSWLQSCARVRALTFTPARQAHACLNLYRHLQAETPAIAPRIAFA